MLYVDKLKREDIVKPMFFVSKLGILVNCESLNHTNDDVLSLYSSQTAISSTITTYPVVSKMFMNSRTNFRCSSKTWYFISHTYAGGAVRN